MRNDDTESPTSRREWLARAVAEGLASGTVDEEPEAIVEQLIAEIPAKRD